MAINVSALLVLKNIRSLYVLMILVNHIGRWFKDMFTNLTLINFELFLVSNNLNRKIYICPKLVQDHFCAYNFENSEQLSGIFKIK